jgi:hypothetical protein
MIKNAIIIAPVQYITRQELLRVIAPLMIMPIETPDPVAKLYILRPSVENRRHPLAYIRHRGSPFMEEEDVCDGRWTKTFSGTREET